MSLSNDNESKFQREQRLLRQIRAEMDKSDPNLGLVELLNREYQSLHFGFDPHDSIRQIRSNDNIRHP